MLIWKIISLSRDHGLETESRGWLEDLLLTLSGKWLVVRMNHLSRSQEYRGSFPGKICGGPSLSDSIIPMIKWKWFLRVSNTLNVQLELKETEIGWNLLKRQSHRYRKWADGIPLWAKNMGSLSQWVQKTDHQVTEDFSQTLKSLYEFSLICFGLTGMHYPFFPSTCSFWNKNFYFMLVPLLWFGSR